MTGGYSHPQYAQSFREFGAPLELVRCESWLLKREIPGSSWHDAMGCYPLFVCHDWSQLKIDLDDASDELICASLVTDPFGRYDEAILRACFKDVMFPFKQHFVADLSQPLKGFVAGHHQRNARNTLRVVGVEKCERPEEHIDDWVNLYAVLVGRHDIHGLAAFSRESFSGQMSVPGLTAFRAVNNGAVVGMTLWYNHETVGYYHLGAYSELGYELRASFALFWFAFEYFAATGLRWLDLGAGAGIETNGADGLSRFKRGWSTGTRTSYFCGRIFDHKKYQDIVRAQRLPPTKYFPAYRLGEFV